MAVAAAETMHEIEPQVKSRRTDSILFNVYYLHDHILDRDSGKFEQAAAMDVLEQNVTDIAEADIHNFGPNVIQEWDPDRKQYVSLETGTISNNFKGLRALDFDDEPAEFEYFRRVEEIVEEESIFWPHVYEGMRKGGKKVFISPAPTHHEADSDVATSFGYDDRTMFRVQSLMDAGRRKRMASYSVFDVPAKSWAAYLSDRYQAKVEPTALAIMEFCHQLPLESGLTKDIVEAFISGVLPYLPEADRPKVQKQLDAFRDDQITLQVKAEFYASEKLKIQKELALSLHDWATPPIEQLIKTVEKNLSAEQKAALDQRRQNGKLKVDDFVAELVMQIKTVTTNNRAGFAVENRRTVMRAKARMGQEAVAQLVAQEQMIQRMSANGVNDFLIQRSEQQIAQAGLGCGGGCSVSVLDVFSPDAKLARDAGLEGTLYKWSKEESKNSKCSCINKANAEVISDGKNAICKTCGDGTRKSHVKKSSTAQAA